MIHPVNKKVFTLIIAFLLVFICSRIYPQESNTLYFMDRIPQSNLLNPALQPYYNFSLGLPATSDFYFRYDNTSLAIKDIIFKGTGDYSGVFITPLHPSYDPHNFINKLENSNHFQEEIQTNLFSLGFRVKTVYINFNLTEKYFMNFAYPGDLMSFIMLGTEEFENRPADFSGFDFDIKNYRELGVGLSKSFMGERLFVGVRTKLLYGLANFHSETMDIQLEATPAHWKYYNDMQFNASFPLTLDETERNIFNAMELNLDDPVEFLMNFKNRGFALDIGGIYNVTDKIAVSASIIDMGSINWKDNTYQFNINADTISFEGIDLDSEENSTFDALLDSLNNAFDYTYTTNPFKTKVATKYYLGATYELTKRINFGLLSRTHVYRKGITQSFTLSANFNPLNFLCLSGSYTLMKDRLANFGVGFGLKFGPSQWYFVSDNLSQAIYPLRTQSLSFRFGMNIVIGSKKKKEKKAEDNKDIPLLDTEDLLIEE